MKIKHFLLRYRMALLTLCLMMTAEYAYCVQVTLNDGRILSGTLAGIDKHQIYIDTHNVRCRISHNDITAVSGDTFGEPEMITVTLRSRRSLNIILILLTADTLIYRTEDNVNVLHRIDRNEIMRIEPIQTRQNDTDNDQIQITDIDSIVSAASKPSDVSSDNDANDIAESSDFYDKYWLRFNGHLDKATGSILWNLIDIYTDKEKNLSLIYNGLLSSDKDKTEIRIFSVNQELQSKIHQLRIEFKDRANKIMLRMGQR